MIDKFILHFDRALRTTAGTVGSTDRLSPGIPIKNTPLTQEARRLSAGLMRINHTGEVCAQALYHGQALTAQSSRVANSMREAAEEETDHLSWCENRLHELDSRVSYLNPFWYASSFLMGATTGLLGDKINLGFVAAVEDGVCKHITEHLERLPKEDNKSRAILTQMKIDEEKHMHTALEAGGSEFPSLVKSLMNLVSKVMTKSTYWV
ncbi:MAG: 2-polyprenyl-3-methyl-6-methoxy-1,4-benzoquinone monooxygenase [Pseudomonadales bacterium]|nr:2-polyprenyl-3-methyl-6-methoxy-1,4-benzoquinone monooxygenase [Pseudomonadales bacterium]